MGRQYITTTSFTSPWVDTYPWDNGFKTKYGAPSTIFHSGTPGAIALRPKFTPNGNAIVYVYGTSPRIGAYPFSNSGGYGTAFVGSSPNPGATGSSLSFISQTEFAATSNSTPYAQTLTFSSTSGFGATRYTPPATAPTGGRYVSASSNVMFFSFLGTPFIGMWPATNPGFGTKFANPSPLPVSAPPALYGQFITHSANDVAICTNNSPHYSAYPWSISSGFGTRYTLPTNPGNITYAIEFSKDGQQLAIATAFTPYIFVYPWVTGTGPGTKFANPATLPAGQIRAISFGNSDIFIGHAGSPYLSVYPWSSSGFGTKYADPSTTITADTVVGTSYINVLGYTLNALPYAFNGLTYSQSGVYSTYENATELVMTDGLGTSRVQTVAYTEAGTYAETYVQLDLGKASVINGIVVGTDYSGNMGFSQVYTDNKDLSVSTNGSSWTTVGSTGTFASSIKTVSITPVSARYIKVSKPGGDASASYLPVTQFYPTTTSSYQFNGIAANLVKASAPKVLVADATLFTLTGNETNLTKSTAYSLVTTAGAYGETGQSITLLLTPASATSYTMTATTVSFAETGIAAGLKVDRVVAATTQSFALTGIATNLKAARTITGAVRTFALTGIANRLATTRTISASTTSFALTGQSAGLQFSHKVTASPASFALTGVSATLVAERRTACATGSFTLTGINSGLATTRTITVSAATFSLTGYDASLVATTAKTLFAAIGHFALTGVDSHLAAIRTVSIDTGTFALSGQSVTLKVGRVVGATTGTFALAGSAAVLIHNFNLLASSRLFALSGIAAAITTSRKVAPDSGNFVEFGKVIGLYYGRIALGATGQFLLTGNTVNLEELKGIVAGTGQFALSGIDSILVGPLPPVIRSIVLGEATIAPITTSEIVVSSTFALGNNGSCHDYTSLYSESS